MRLLRLDLLAFGPFTGVSLAFDQGRPGLHIVYGPNEAGKTSSLRALRQWLYGIPHNSPDNFLHANPNLRIGGVLESADGGRLEFIRRKGRSKTLRAADDAEVMDESRLEALLGGMDEATFRRRFGIDYEELRSGGEAVVRGGGDLGDILFAAGAGVADLGRVREGLDADAEKLFKPRGSVQQINKAISELDAARRTIKDALLPTTEWVKHDKALRDAQKRRKDIEAQLADKRAAESRLRRLEEALPLIGRRKGLAEALAELAGVPLLPPDFPSRRSAAVAEHRGRRQAEREAANAVERLTEQMARVTVPTELLAHRTAIGQLHTALGSHVKAARDRPVLAAQLSDAQRRVLEILEELGREPRLEQAEQLHLSRTQRQRIQALAGEWKARQERHVAAARAVTKLQEAIRRNEAELEAIPPARDAGGLRQAIRLARKHGDVDEQLARARAELRRMEERAEIDLGKLRLWSGTLEEVERLAVPAAETVDRFENHLADASAEVERIEQRLDEAARNAAKLDQDLERLRLEHDVPTEDDLLEARRRRDEAWHQVRRAWQEGRPAGQLGNGDLAQAFEAGMAEADALADRLRREADRVAQKAKLTADRHDVDQQLGEFRDALDRAGQARDRLQGQWCGEWAALGIEPLSPREMRSWRNQQQALAGLAEDIRTRRAAAGELAERIRSLRDELRQRLEPLERPLPDEDDTLGRALEYGEAVAEEIESASQRRGQHEKELQKLRGDLREATADVERAGDDLEQWQNDWAVAVAALGLHRDAEPSEANAVLDAVEEMLRLRKEADGLRSRIEGIDHDAGAFQQSVRQLVGHVAGDLAELPAERAVADLYDRVDAAGKAQTKLDGWKEQREAEEAKRDKARSKAEQLQREIEAMCREAGCHSADELPAAEQRSAKRREIESEWNRVVERLTELAAGGPLDEFIAEAERSNPDRLRADLQARAGEIDQLEAEQKTVAEEIGSHRNELQRMDGSGRAAEAQEQAEYLLAGIRADAEQYARLRLAAAVLHRAIERFRDASQGPVLDRASDWFAALTLGSFSGLRADYDDKGGAVLMGIRAGTGQPVGVEGMSGGTCDQLYLALRLTLLETYLHAHEPLPFIVDDILIMFDDDRAVAALKALAQLSQRTQVIFFTHHEHLLELARSNVDHGELCIHSLGGTGGSLEQADG